MVALLGLASCNSGKSEEEAAAEARADATKQELETAVADRDQLLSLVNEINTGMEQIKQLENILTAAPAEVETAISKFPVSAISMGNFKLQACLSDDSQFAALQLLAYKDFGYKPVTEMKVYTGRTAEVFSRLFA